MRVYKSDDVQLRSIELTKEEIQRILQGETIRYRDMLAMRNPYLIEIFMEEQEDENGRNRLSVV